MSSFSDLSPGVCFTSHSPVFNAALYCSGLLKLKINQSGEKRRNIGIPVTRVSITPGMLFWFVGFCLVFFSFPCIIINHAYWWNADWQQTGILSRYHHFLTGTLKPLQDNAVIRYHSTMLLLPRPHTCEKELHKSWVLTFQIWFKSQPLNL